ncbi:MAG: DUF4139 domain-containing protein [Proteobacteria bacterium]|nr:DUF4139 domain-containing protein [Pseudomonadota bacterium]
MEAARVKSRIVGVTVYREGARVRRIAEVSQSGPGDTTVEPGSRYPTVICLSGLPLAMQDSSVRVRVERAADNSEGRLPLAVDAHVTLDVPEVEDQIAEPVADELEAARRRVRVIDGRIAQIKRELARVQRLAVVPRPNKVGRKGEVPGPPPQSPIGSRLALLEMRAGRERALRNELAEVEKEHREASRIAKKLADQQMRATTARKVREHELRKAVVVTLSEPDPGSASQGGTRPARRFRLTLHYAVPGARWAPAYSVHLNGDKQARFTMRAVVAQQTGEDWRGVTLALSTADFLGWSELPELASIRIGRRQPTGHETGWRSPPSGTDLLYADYDRAFSRTTQARPDRELPGLDDEDSREITTPMRPYEAAASDVLVTGEYAGYEEPADGESAWYEEESGEKTVPAVPLQPLSAGSQPVFAQPAPKSPMAPEEPVALLRGQLLRREQKPADMPELMSEAAPGAGAGGSSDEVMFRSALASSLQPPPSGPPRGGADRSTIHTGTESADQPIVDAGAELLAYGDLRMPPARSDRRGVLRLARPAELYLEFLVTQRIEVGFDVLAVISAAKRRADAVARVQLPPRHVRIRSDYYDYVYLADTAVDIPSDGAFHSIPLLVHDAEVVTHYVVVPGQSTDVYRVAKLANPLGAPILDGPIDVYLERDFLLTSDVSFTPPGGVLRLGLGVEQAVKVSRNTSFHEESAGLIRGSLALKHQIRIEVHNHLDRPIDCEVRERIPVTGDDRDDIEVTVEQTEPAWHSYQPDLAEAPAEADLKGGYYWRIPVESGQRRVLEADYSIKISAKHELVGGNRREV